LSNVQTNPLNVSLFIFNTAAISGGEIKLINVLSVSGVENITVITKESTSSNTLHVLIDCSVNMQFKWVLRNLMNIGYRFGLSNDVCLERKDGAILDVSVVLIDSRWQSLDGWTSDAATRFVENTAPDTIREVVVSFCDSLILCALERGLHAASKHDVVSLVQVSIWIFWEIEEHWSVEGTATLRDHAHFSVVVWNESQLGLHCVSNHVSVANTSQRVVIKHIRLL